MLYIALLFLVEVLLFVTNYIPGTYLMGWDNIMPEFNLALNLKRSLFGVWQEYRGLGLLDGLAHTANLFHTFYIWFLSLVLPQSAVRYVFLFLIHFLGGAAFFYLAKYLAKSKKSAFIASLFYMLNIGVIQMFFAPLEVFAFHFLALPLLTLTTLKALNEPTKKNLLLFALSALLTTPQGFVPTLFIVFMFLFGLLLFFQKNKRKVVGILLGIFLAINSFWLIPYSYSAVKNSKIIPQTRINRFSSEEIFYRNKSFGGALNVLKLKGFMLDAVEYDQEKKLNDYFMSSWKSYEKTVLYNLAYATLLGIAIFGLFKIIKTKQRDFYPFVGAFVGAFVLLANNTPLLEQFNNLLRTIPVFAEVFRIPFTKFIILFVFCLAIFLAYGIKNLITKSAKDAKYLITGFAITIFVLSYPAFQGYFFSPSLKIDLPKDYLQTIDYLNQKDENQRIALLPAHTFWNWQYRSFGYRGSDFLWYGIKQPILLRAFDPWSLQNQKFYDELSMAINSDNLQEFDRVLNKYQVSYLLLDKYLVNNVTNKPINYSRLEKFLNQANQVKKETEFGKLVIYKNTRPTYPVFTAQEPTYQSLDGLLSKYEVKDNEIKTSAVLNTISSKNAYLTIPNMFDKEGLIPVKFSVNNGQLLLTPIYPVLEVNEQPVELAAKPIQLTLNRVLNPNKIELNDTKYVIKPGQTTYIRNNYLNTFSLENGETKELVIFDTRDYDFQKEPFVIKLDSATEITFRIPVFDSPYTLKNLVKKSQYDVKIPFEDLQELKTNGAYHRVEKGNDSLKIEARGESVDVSFWMPTLRHDASYLAEADTGYVSGLPVTFYVDNTFEKRAETEERLDKNSSSQAVLIPPTQKFFTGYGFHLVVKSLGNEKARSEIKDLSILPIPYKTLANARISGQENPTQATYPLPANFEKKNITSYVVTLPKYSGLLVLNQSYHDGWVAYSDGKKLEKVEYEGWANGWRVDTEGPAKIKIIFWPQYLEFVGFGLIVLAFTAIIVLYGKNRFKPSSN